MIKFGIFPKTIGACSQLRTEATNLRNCRSRNDDVGTPKRSLQLAPLVAQIRKQHHLIKIYVLLEPFWPLAMVVHEDSALNYLRKATAKNVSDAFQIDALANHIIVNHCYDVAGGRLEGGVNSIALAEFFLLDIAEMSRK